MSENLSQSAQTCPGTGSQTAMICLPVTVSPYAVAGPAVIHCCGDMDVVPNCGHCKGKVNGTCEFVVKQMIRVDIPVEFGAAVKIGDTYVECKCVGSEPVEVECGCGCLEDE